MPNSTWLVQGVAVRVTAVGDHADFVFLQIEHEVFYMHDIRPLMMVWPPTFPQLNGARDQAE
jgi:hypothetical protein